MPIRREPCKCDVYSRVTGFFRPISSWNKGKRAEFKDRRNYILQNINI